MERNKIILSKPVKGELVENGNQVRVWSGTFDIINVKVVGRSIVIIAPEHEGKEVDIAIDDLLQD